jgi:hypothetical protein
MKAYAHEAVLTMDGDSDERAPGAAITVALCGHWEHEPPCPLAPHHTSAERTGDRVAIRTMFVAREQDEDEVRRRIGAALAAGRLVSQEGVTTQWHLESANRSDVRPEERAHAARLSS